jgi:hypothetical protein
MRTTALLLRLSATFVLVALVGCAGSPPTSKAPPELTSTRILDEEAERALADLRHARSEIKSLPKDAEQALAKAEATILRLSTYYLPVLEARGLAYNAYRAHALGDKGLCKSELDRVEEVLLGVVEGLGEPLGQELQGPLETLVDARIALAGAPDQSSDRLEDLLERLNLILVKGELVAPEGEVARRD